MLQRIVEMLQRAVDLLEVGNGITCKCITYDIHVFILFQLFAPITTIYLVKLLTCQSPISSVDSLKKVHLINTLMNNTS